MCLSLPTNAYVYIRKNSRIEMTRAKGAKPTILMPLPKRSNIIRSETIVLVMGLLIFLQSYRRSIKDPSYDPTAMYTLSIGLVTAGRLAPTDKLDQPIQEFASHYDRDLFLKLEEKREETEQV